MLLEIELLCIKCKRSVVWIDITNHKTKFHFVKGGKSFQRSQEIISNINLGINDYFSKKQRV